jgi:LPXTG-motif cell wall-anchored protein
MALPKPDPANRCDRLFNLTNPAPPLTDPDALPGMVDAPWGEDTPTYSYENPGENARGKPDLTANWKNDLEALVEKYSTNTRKLDSGTDEHLYAARMRHITTRLNKGKQPLSWEKWLTSYITAQGNNAKGKTYEKLIIERFGLVGEDWYCQVGLDETGNRKLDAVNYKLKRALELKSGDRVDSKQLAADKLRIKQLDAQEPGWKMSYAFGGEVRQKTIDNVQAGTEGRITAGKARAYPVVSNAKPESAPILNPEENTPATGAATDFIQGSADTEAEALELDETFLEETRQAALDAAAREGIAEEQALATAIEETALRPGGIDFTTLELRYVADDGDGVKFAFKAQEAPDNVHSFGGLEAAELSSDALFAWLALPPSAFWVNLNPEQPDVIIDPQLGRTDAGRVLLQADLAMKRTAGRLLDPSKSPGKEFWDQAQAPQGQPLPCFLFRNWIVPDTASVRENDGELFVLDAPLLVKSAPFSLKDPPGGSTCADQPESITKYNQQLFERLIIPKVEQAINTDPQYEDLRRVFLSRVIAEWIRQRSASKPNAYTPIIGSGDISRWVARTPWNPQDVYQEYLNSFRNGDFNYTVTRIVDGKEVVVSFSIGGVDFASAPRSSLDAPTFTQRFPALPATVEQSRFSLIDDVKDEGRTWLGAGTAPASVPVPPAAPANGGDQPNAGNQDLPATGTQTTRIALVGLALLICGGVLVFSMRRRKRTTPQT